MKFDETLLHSVLTMPTKQLKKDCWYIFALKIPVIISMTFFGIIIAIIVDFIYAIKELHD